MSPTMPAAFFDRDRDWLSRQPGMNPWDKGCARLWDQMIQWLREELTSWGVDPGVLDSGGQWMGGFVNRQWGCWSHHWRDAIAANHQNPVNGIEVANKIRKGEGYRGGGKLHGDVIAEVILAEGCCLKENKTIQDWAARRFESQYRGYCLEVACKVNRGIRREQEEFWNNAFIQLVAGKNGGKLRRFEGRCGLKPWLKTVIGRLALDYKPEARWWQRLLALIFRRENKNPPDPRRTDLETLERTEQVQDREERLPETPLIQKETEEKLRQKLREFIQRLPPERRQIFKLCIQGYTCTQIAKVVDKHSGHVSRIIKQLLDERRRFLEEGDPP